MPASARKRTSPTALAAACALLAIAFGLAACGGGGGGGTPDPVALDPGPGGSPAPAPSPAPAAPQLAAVAGAPVDDWWWTAASADGSTQAALVNFSLDNGGMGNLHVSRDAGARWQVAPAPLARWSSVAISDDGSRLAATAFDGQLWLSTDHGQAWREVRPEPAPQPWLSVAMSGDGRRLAAVVKDGGLYTSVDGGDSWSLRTSAGTRDWAGVAMSADGQRLAAVAHPPTAGSPPGDQAGGIWVSDDGGQGWQARNPPSGEVDGYRIASSADGRHLLVGVWKIGGEYGAPGQRLFSSADRGLTWTAFDYAAPVHQVSLSADGTRAVAAVGGLPLQLSVDGGRSWQGLGDALAWRGAALSGDGRVLVAGDHGRIPLEVRPGDTGGRLYLGSVPR